MANIQIFNLILPIVVMVLFVIALFLVTGLWRRTTWGRKLFPSRKKSPLRDNLIRGPGQALQDQLLDKLIDFALTGCSGVVMLVVVCFVPFLLGLGALAIIVWLILGFFLLWILLKLRNQSKEIQYLKLGLDGELATAEELNQLMQHGYYVFHDFPADKFNIDHIVIGSAGVFAVETKTRSKAVGAGKQGAKVLFENFQLKFPNYRESDSIQQANDQAKWLSKFLEKSVGKVIPVKPVLALPGWLVERRSKDASIMVINPREVLDYIKTKPNVLDDQTIQQISYQVELRCRTIAPYRPI